MLNAPHSKTGLHSRIRVLVVDDSVVVRKILSDVLRENPDMEVVGSAPNGVVALQRIAQWNPDLVTLDIEMPELDGIATLREIKRNHPHVRVIMCSSLTERGAGITMEALSLGADDYLTKVSAATGPAAIEALRTQLIPKVRQFFPRGDAAKPPLPPVPRERQATMGPALVRPSMTPPRSIVRHNRLRAVVVGVSTGGPNALAEVIPALPADTPVPIFIVQHMPPMFTRLLAERLQSQSKLQVMEAKEGMVAAAGHVYIAPGDFHMTLARSGYDVVIRLNQEQPENSCRPAVDVLFRSAAGVYGGAVVAVVLTGMGQDGFRGVEHLRSLGAHVIVQDEASSVVWGMPGYVARGGLADSVCDLRRIAPEITHQLRG